nr:hypothetical protein [Microlunatus endophyticus]
MGSIPAAHWPAAACAERNPLTLDRATRSTGAPVGGRPCGQLWSVATHPGCSAAMVDSPAPPWVPTIQSAAKSVRIRIGS